MLHINFNAHTPLIFLVDIQIIMLLGKFFPLVCAHAHKLARAHRGYKVRCWRKRFEVRLIWRKKSQVLWFKKSNSLEINVCMPCRFEEAAAVSEERAEGMGGHV